MDEDDVKIYVPSPSVYSDKEHPDTEFVRIYQSGF